MPGTFRAAETLRTERYEPAHPAPDAPTDQRGSGVLWGTWIACEEPGAEEGWLRSGIELVMDSRLEPSAAIGRHQHVGTEELYIVLEGSLRVTAGTSDVQVETMELQPGDVHRVAPGGWHTARAGADGARIIVIAAKAE